MDIPPLFRLNCPHRIHVYSSEEILRQTIEGDGGTYIGKGGMDGVRRRNGYAVSRRNGYGKKG